MPPLSRSNSVSSRSSNKRAPSRSGRRSAKLDDSDDSDNGRRKRSKSPKKGGAKNNKKKKKKKLSDDSSLSDSVSDESIDKVLTKGDKGKSKSFFGGITRRLSKAEYESDISESEDSLISDKKNKNTGAYKGGKVVDLALERIFGYRGYDAHDNVNYLDSGSIVYYSAAVGIILDPSTKKQSFFVEHSDDILSCAVHPDGELIATGESGRKPSIIIWDSKTMKAVNTLAGAHLRGVNHLDFSPDGRFLLSIGLDDSHTVKVHTWKDGREVAKAKGHNDKILCAAFRPDDSNALVTGGVKHIKFWTIEDFSLQNKRGIFGKEGSAQTMFSLAFGGQGTTYSGAQDGSVCVWNNNTLSKTVPAHDGPVLAMYTSPNGVVTGGKDGLVQVWDAKMRDVKNSITLGKKRTVRSLCRHKNSIIVGTKAGELLEVTIRDEKVSVLMSGHGEGEIWGLDTHPTDDTAATASDDKMVKLWSLKKGKLIASLNTKAEARSVAFSGDGDCIAVGFKDGSFRVYKSSLKGDPIVEKKDRKEMIGDIKFSPDGRFLAVASNDNFVDLYHTGSYKKFGTCKGMSSFVTHIDWTRNGKYLQVNSGAYEHLYFTMPDCKPASAKHDALERIGWATYTGVLGPFLSGIWPKGSDKTDINSCDLAKCQKTLATGDDFGMVKLFDYPCQGKFVKPLKEYRGHSSHVTKVKFSHDNTHMVSVGGADTSVFVWKCKTRGGKNSKRGIDSEEDSDYDSDASRKVSSKKSKGSRFAEFDSDSDDFVDKKKKKLGKKKLKDSDDDSDTDSKFSKKGGKKSKKATSDSDDSDEDSDDFKKKKSKKKSPKKKIIDSEDSLDSSDSDSDGKKKLSKSKKKKKGGKASSSEDSDSSDDDGGRKKKKRHSRPPAKSSTCILL